MDKIPRLGNLITDHQEKDAIHIAVAPVIAGMTLEPGSRIGFMGDGNSYTVGTDTRIIGIVDPFLTDNVRKGQKFYMFLLPNTITSLRHEWTHPDFEAEDELAKFEPTFLKLKGFPAEEKWIAEFAQSIGTNYTELMEAAERYQTSGQYFSKGDTFDGCYITAGFWEKYETITSENVNDRGTFLSCSC